MAMHFGDAPSSESRIVTPVTRSPSRSSDTTCLTTAPPRRIKPRCATVMVCLASSTTVS
jgi:hypothetical protein